MKFKNLKLSNPEILWLKAIYENGSIPDPITFRVKLHGQLPEDFNYENLHRCFVWNGRLSLHGIWVLNPEDKAFGNLDKVIKVIRDKIKETPKLQTVTAEETAKETGLSLKTARETLWYLGNHPGYWASGVKTAGEFSQDVIGFGGDGHINKYLGYKDIPTLLENTWEEMGLGNYIRPKVAKPAEEIREPETVKTPKAEKTWLCYTKLCHTIYCGREKWAFQDNAAQVVRVLIDAYEKGVQEIHIKQIHASIGREMQSQSLSQVFKKRDKDAAWRKLIIDGSGKGFYRLNPKYLENGIQEIDLSQATNDEKP